MTIVRLGKASDVPLGKGRKMVASGRELAVFNVDGCFHAIDNTCTHRGGPLGEGELEGSVVTCPWHGWQYDVTTGVCVANPAAKVVRYEVQVDGIDVKVLI